MKLLIGWMMLCFVVGVVLRRRSLKLHTWLLFVGCVLVAIGYYFFRQI